LSLSLVHGGSLDEEADIGSLTIPGYAKEITDRFADREAICSWGATGRTAWSYAQLWESSVEVAKALIAIGVGKDSRVGILMTNRPEYLASVFGVAMAGGVSVALSTFSTQSELEYLLEAGAVSILLYDRQVLKKDFGAMLAAIEPQISNATPGTFTSAKLPFLSHLVALDPETQTSGPAAPDAPMVLRWREFLDEGGTVATSTVEARAKTVHPSDTGAIFFSSGTTSLPKGIVHAQRALALQWWRWPRIYDIDPANHPVRAWTGNGFFWSGNISMVVGNALTTGGAIVLQPLFDADEALDLIEKESVTYLNGRPHQWARLQASPRWSQVDLSSLHYITYSDILMSHPTVKTSWSLCPAFGTTETLTINTAVGANVPFDVYKGSYGRPLPGNILKVFDPDTGAIVPVGERGEIAIKGPTLMVRYLGKTIEDCFDTDGFFCTGDGGYVDEDGYLFWEGRLTEMIKTGGANVSPIEIDLALANFPGVKRAQTVGVPDPLLGEMVVSCIVPHDRAELSADSITAFLKEQFASFKVPRAIVFLTEDEMNVTGSGKVKFRQLRDLAAKRLEASPP
jgi:acyl-CoA synthetase (AMP-forming)/AMP-acid ligase II